MKKAASKPGTRRTPPPGTPGWYRGIQLAPLVNPPTTPAEVLDRPSRRLSRSMPPSSTPRLSPPAKRSVFINCPFDPAYQALFRATRFAVVACGHMPRCALDEPDSAVIRFNCILDLITEAEFSIHDLSRVELDSSSGLPRFNMPLELGTDLALRLRGPARHRRRRILVLDATPHRCDQTLSDISGMDIEVHGNDVSRIIRVTRDWLNAGRGAAPPLPGGAAVVADYGAFQSIAEEVIEELRLDRFDALPHIDFMYIVEETLPRIEAARRRSRRSAEPEG